MRSIGTGHDPYEKLLDEMMSRTLQGEVIPFDEWLDAMDELSEEPERVPTAAEIEEAEAARLSFQERVKEFGLPLERRFALCQEVLRLARRRPSQKLLHLLCCIICDSGMLLDMDPLNRDLEQNALVWPELRHEAEELYAILSTRKGQIARFRQTVADAGRVIPEITASAQENAAFQEQVYEAYTRIFPSAHARPMLKDNILWLLQIADAKPALHSVKPLFLYRVLTRHRKRMETEQSVRLDFRALWKRQEYNILKDNGKNFQSHARALMLFESLYQILGTEDGVDLQLCLVGFDCLSNLGEYYRLYPEEKWLLPFPPSVDSLFEQVAFSCFEHGYGDNRMMEAGHVSVTQLNRFLAGRLGNDPKAIGRISNEIHRNRETFLALFLEADALPDEGQRDQHVRGLCTKILDAAELSEEQRPATAQETALYLAAVNSFLMEAVDDRAEECLNAAAKLLCGEIQAEGGGQ